MNPKMRLIVNAIPLTYVHTGIARYLRSLYTEMERKHSSELEIWYFDGKSISQSMPQGPNRLDQWSRLADMFWKLPWPAALALRLALHFRTEHKFYKQAQGFDVYHEAGFFPLKTPPGVRTVFTVHDMSLFRFPQHHPRERVVFHKLFWKKRSHQVDQFLAVSEFTKHELQIYLRSGQNAITVAPLAHDPDIFYPRSEIRVQAFIQEQSLPQTYFLFVGSGDPRKNMHCIPQSLQAAGLDIPLVVAGWSGWSKNQLPENVHLTGYVTDQELALLYSGAIALVFPSTYEGFGLPVLEAMACRCPVVTTKEASLPEVAGDAALYVQDPLDPLELGMLLKDLAVDGAKRRGLSDRGLGRVAGFSWERTAQITFRAMQEMYEVYITKKIYPTGHQENEEYTPTEHSEYTKQRVV